MGCLRLTYCKIEPTLKVVYKNLKISSKSCAGSYRYSFNGMEKDDEVKGEGNSYDYGARMLDPRLGRWLKRDPLEVKYPNLSTYAFVGNSPILCKDPDGRKIKPTNDDAAQVLFSIATDFNSAGFNITQNKEGEFIENADTYSVINGIAAGEKWSVSSEKEFNKKMKKYNSNYTKEDLTDLYAIYLGIQKPEVIEIQVTTSGTGGGDFVYRGSQGTEGAVVQTGNITTVNSENTELYNVQVQAGSITEKVGKVMYNGESITLNYPATEETEAKTETVTITPDKRGTDWIYFKDENKVSSIKGQIYVDGTNKTVGMCKGIIGKALTEIYK